MKNIFLLLVLTLGIASGFAQNEVRFSGFILDANDNQPVEFVNINLLRQDSTYLGSAITDSLGHFSISFQGDLNNNYMLNFSHLTYEKNSILSTPADNIRVQLNPSGYNLSEVQVKGIRTKAINRLNMEYLVSENLKKQCDLTSEILEKIPTLFVDCNSNVYVKGNSNVLLLKDGVKISHKSMLDLIPSGSVQKVIVSYHIPSKYANENYSAAINIITKRTDGLTLLISPMASVDNSWYDTKANLNLEKGKNSVMFGYRMHYRDLIAHTTNTRFDLSEATKTFAEIKSNPYSWKDNELFAGYTYNPSSKVQFGAEGYLSLFRENTKKEYELDHRKYNGYHERFNTQNYKAFVSYKDSVRQALVEVSYNNENIKDEDEYFLSQIQTFQNTLKDSYRFNAEYNTKIASKAELNSGFKYEHVSNRGSYVNSEKLFSGGYHGNTYSLYAECNYIANNHITLNGGLNMYSYQRKFDEGQEVKNFNIFPKFMLSYAWNIHHNITFAYSSHIKEPTLWSLLPFVKEETPGIYSKGTPDLKPVRTDKISCEYSFSKGNLYVSLTPYYKRIKNKIVSMEENYLDGSLVYNDNLKKYQEWGTELSFSDNLFSWWIVNANVCGYRQYISENSYYNKCLNTIDWQLVSYWSLAKKWAITLQYIHNGKQLSYNGYIKPSNTNLAQLTYKVNKRMKLYLIYVYPFGKMDDERYICSDKKTITTYQKIDVQKVLLSFTYNFNKGKKSNKKDIYINVDKKYE